jgi:lipid-A-disaccharide synthase
MSRKNSTNHNSLVIISGEVSGDIHGARLLAALKELQPNIVLSGIGGDLMIAQGLQARHHIKEMAFLGIGEIIKHLPFIRRVFKDMVNHIRTVNPAAVVLIDYPGFNLRIAKTIKRLGIPIIYYISPQLWAWGKRRVNVIKHFVDRLLVIFPFEVDFYRQYGIQADYVGHPLVDSYHGSVSLKKSDVDADIVLGLLPGSRHQEVEKLLPDMLITAGILKDRGKIDKALVARIEHIPKEFYQEYLKDYDFIELYQSSMNNFYNQLDAAIVSSGTATLETAYFQVPMIIVYRVSNFTWLLGKFLIKLDSIGLANIVAQETVADELLQDDFNPLVAAQIIEQLLLPDKNVFIRDRLKVVQHKLGPPGASRRAAQMIIDFISGD